MLINEKICHPEQQEQSAKRSGVTFYATAEFQGLKYYKFYIRLICFIRDAETVLDYWRLDRLNAALAKTCWVRYAHTAHLPKSAVQHD